MWFGCEIMKFEKIQGVSLLSMEPAFHDDCFQHRNSVKQLSKIVAGLRKRHDQTNHPNMTGLNKLAENLWHHGSTMARKLEYTDFDIRRHLTKRIRSGRHGIFSGLLRITMPLLLVNDKTMWDCCYPSVETPVERRRVVERSCKV